VESFRLLLNSGARKDARDSYGRTLLMAAAASGSPEMVKEVLRLKPDVNAASQLPDGAENDRDRSQEGFTALMAAVSSRDYDVPPEGVDRKEVVRLLLQAGANPNLRNHDGDTALILCHGGADLALLLIKAGADVNVEDNQGRTALSNTYDKDLQRVLREHGAIGKAADEK
jgi:ankyrin repeat protein